MALSPRKRIGILFGGRSVEHEVSVITGLQAASALDSARFEAVPVYLSKEGEWFTGPDLLDLDLYKDLADVKQRGMRVYPTSNDTGGIDLILTKRRILGSSLAARTDVALVAMHGSEGENGSLQGLLETLNTAYTGSDVTASAVGMDKSLSKIIARHAGVPVLDDIVIRDAEWVGDEDEWLDRCTERFGFPMMVKPMRLGSSIGIERAEDRQQLESAIEEVFRLDNRVLVEPCISELREFNCSVLARLQGPQASVIEEPVRATEDDILSFEQKYQRAGSSKSGSKQDRSDAGMASLDRVIPADVPHEKNSYLQDLAVRVFTAVGCAGVARIDFLYDAAKEEFYFNEINTIPGSFSFYLWEPTGIPFSDLLEELIEGARRQFRLRNAKVRSYETNLLSMNALSGIKK